MKNTMKRGIARLLVFVMCLSLLQVAAFADDEISSDDPLVPAVTEIEEDCAPAEGQETDDEEPESVDTPDESAAIDESEEIAEPEAGETGDGEEIAQTQADEPGDAEEPGDPQQPGSGEDPADPVEVPDVNPGLDKEHDKSKTATELDRHGVSTVTLSVPSSVQRLSSDLVFVLDKSSCGEATMAKFGELLTQLKAAQAISRATIKVGIVVFNWRSNVALELTDITTMSVEEMVALTSGYSGGTNMDAGLTAAEIMLDADTDVEDARKHMVLVSDGLTWLWESNDEPGTMMTLNSLNKSGAQAYGLPGSFQYVRYGNGITLAKLKTFDWYKDSYSVPYGWEWSEYWNKIAGWVAQDREDGDVYPYAVSSYDKTLLVGETPIATLANEGVDHASNLERALWEAYEPYQRMSEHYKCYAFNSSSSSRYTVGREFMNMLNGGATLDFNEIRDDLLYALGAGSYVEDYIGCGDDYDFDFVDGAENLTMKVGSTSYAAVALEDSGSADSAYGFKPVTGESGEVSYAYVVKYTRGSGAADEKLVWEINENVSNYAPAALSYKVRLVEKSDEPGEHTAYTNVSATLYPVDSKGEAGEPELFERPEITYKVRTEEPVVTPGTDKEHDKSKTATPLDRRGYSTITLSVPSEEQHLAADVVFVLDKSSCNTNGAAKNQFTELVTQLKEAQAATGTTIKVGIVVFNWQSNVALELTDVSTMSVEELVALADGYSGGTNMDAGLTAAEAMLEADTEVEDARKHVILISDGLTWLWANNDEPGTMMTVNAKSLIPSQTQTYGLNTCFFSVRYGRYYSAKVSKEFRDKYPWYKDTYSVPFDWDWADYWDKITAWVEQDRADGDLYPYAVTVYAKENMVGETAIPTVANEGVDHASNLERAMYEAYETYHRMSRSYRCYAFNPVFAEGSYTVGQEFMAMLNGGANLDFNEIRDDVLYALGAGSRVEDYIGCGDDYDFDFVDDAKGLTLKVGDASYKAVKLESDGKATSIYGFKPVENEGATTYAYVLRYTRGNGADEELLVWEINENVSNYAPAALSYMVRLVEKSNRTGEHTAYPNISATLYPVDSEGNPGEPELFERPALTYTVRAPGSDPIPTPTQDPEPTPTPTPTPNPEPTPEPQPQPEPVVEIPDPEIPLDGPAPAGEVPKTGDESSIVLWSVLALFAAAGVIVLVLDEKRRTAI